MDRRLEMMEALTDLSRASQRVARLISEGVLGEFKDETILTALGDSRETIDIAKFADWPAATTRIHRDPLDFTDMDVLELCTGPQMPVVTAHQIDLITDGWKFEDDQPQNVRIVHYGQYQKQYDVGVIWESLEFTKDPAKWLDAFKRCCRKVYVRFRPWSSRNGAFMSSTLNKAYAHLAMDMDHEIRFKVVRPLATYDTLIKSIGMPIEERRINTIQPETFFTTNEEIMRVIRERTWGTISFDNAIKIMTTESVDYVLGSA